MLNLLIINGLKYKFFRVVIPEPFYDTHMLGIIPKLLYFSRDIYEVSLKIWVCCRLKRLTESYIYYEEERFYY